MAATARPAPDRRRRSMTPRARKPTSRGQPRTAPQPNAFFAAGASTLMAQSQTGTSAKGKRVLVAIGEKLVEMGKLDKADDVVMFRYNQLRAFIGDPDSMDGRAIAAAACRT